MSRQQRRNKEAKEQEFLDAIEQVIGGRLLPWQKPVLLDLRKATLAGESFDFKTAVLESWRQQSKGRSMHE